jgi:general stress protein 26
MIDWTTIDETTRATIRRIVEGCVYGNLATIGTDGLTPRVRPVCAFLEPDFTILVPSHTATRKIAEIAANPRVEIVFCDTEHWQVRFRGEARVETDKAVKKRLIETTLSPKLWLGFFPRAEHDERFVLYRIHSKSVEWMKEWELAYRTP